MTELLVSSVTVMVMEPAETLGSTRAVIWAILEVHEKAHLSSGSFTRL
ncbi:MAG: hypothetical protein ACJ74Q_15825 [Pyrinomonadaceae bacterium]